MLTIYISPYILSSIQRQTVICFKCITLLSFAFPTRPNLIVSYILMNVVAAKKQFKVKELFSLQVTR